MKKMLLAGLAALVILQAYSQSDGNSAETRHLSGFHGVRVSGGIDLILSSGPESVAVSASNSDIRSHMITEVINGILSIHLEQDWNPHSSNPQMKAVVSVTNLDLLEASGGGDIVFQNEITSRGLDIRLSGGGNLKGKLNADQLTINQSGGSNVNLTGKVMDLNVQASGGGNLKGYDLITDFASIHASGGSNSEITVNKELRVVASGGSDVYYKGQAAVKELKSSGGGGVTHKD